MTTIHGITYLFGAGQTALERLAWLATLLAGLTLATFLSVEAYLAWGSFPVITSVSRQQHITSILTQ